MNFLFPYMARWKAVNWTRYHQIFSQLATLGHKIYVLQPPPTNIHETNFQEIDVQIPPNINLFDIPVDARIWKRNFPLNKLIKKGYYSVVSGKHVGAAIKRLHIDVLLVYNLPQYPLLQRAGCFTVFDVADDYVPMLRYELGKFANPFVTSLGRYVMNRMMLKADLITVPSYVLADSIYPYKSNKLKILPNGVDLKELVPSGIDKSAGQKPMVGFVGAFEYFVDLDLILEIARRLPQIQFTLVGSGREFPRIKKNVAEMNLKNVILTGPVPHSKIATYIDAMDICLNVFKRNKVTECAIPIKLFEYFAMKKPVISTGLRELKLFDKQYMVFADTADEFITAIKNFLADKKLAEEYAQRAYRVTIQRYTWNNLARRFLDYIEERKAGR